MSLARLIVPLCLALFSALPADALTIDTFLDDGYVSSTSTVSTTKTTHIPSSRVIGGGRTLSATKSGDKSDGMRRSSQTVTSVRNGLNNLLRECQQTSVCKKK